jgi:hypothetical protein
MIDKEFLDSQNNKFYHETATDIDKALERMAEMSKGSKIILSIEPTVPKTHFSS